MEQIEKFFNYVYFKIFNKLPSDNIPKYLSGVKKRKDNK
tara:strand:+ start:297 stop:413 length:117 start_codon:yes stop_codon:yes gene_type:complete